MWLIGTYTYIPRVWVSLGLGTLILTLPSLPYTPTYGYSKTIGYPSIWVPKALRTYLYLHLYTYYTPFLTSYFLVVGLVFLSVCPIVSNSYKTVSWLVYPYLVFCLCLTTTRDL